VNVARAAIVCMVAVLAAAQPAAKTQRIHTVFIEPFGNKPGAGALRDVFIDKLQRSHKVKITDSRDQADAVIVGSGEMWIKGYMSSNPRIRYVTHESRAVYGGYLSIELKDRQNETLWSYLVTPGKAGAEDAASSMATQMVKKIAPVLEEGPGPRSH
jgi:hypothetical protein